MITCSYHILASTTAIPVTSCHQGGKPPQAMSASYAGLEILRLHMRRVCSGCSLKVEKHPLRRYFESQFLHCSYWGSVVVAANVRTPLESGVSVADKRPVVPARPLHRPCHCTNAMAGFKVAQRVLLNMPAWKDRDFQDRHCNARVILLIQETLLSGPEVAPPPPPRMPRDRRAVSQPYHLC